ncbi:MAG: hypothetical protein INR62_08270 [Rhodospirillales bacterium]|nr:hypothetical protein [Acetobacter sp.]
MPPVRDPQDDATNLVRDHGERASTEALLRLMDAREDETPDDQRHWQAVLGSLAEMRRVERLFDH